MQKLGEESDQIHGYLSSVMNLLFFMEPKPGGYRFEQPASSSQAFPGSSLVPATSQQRAREAPQPCTAEEGEQDEDEHDNCDSVNNNDASSQPGIPRQQPNASSPSPATTQQPARGAV